MIKQDIKIKPETQEDFYKRQIDLRDELIVRLLGQIEAPCSECALKNVCVDGAKYVECMHGLLAALYESENDADKICTIICRKKSDDERGSGNG